MGKDTSVQSSLKLGVNGFGRIGKLTVWHHIARRYFGEIVVNIGRPSGTSLGDIAHYLERDSTYGWLHGYLHGCQGSLVIDSFDESEGTMLVNGVLIRFLRTARNPKDIRWKDNGGPACGGYNRAVSGPDGRAGKNRRIFEGAY